MMSPYKWNKKVRDQQGHTERIRQIEAARAAEAMALLAAATAVAEARLKSNRIIVHFVKD